MFVDIMTLIWFSWVVCAEQDYTCLDELPSDIEVQLPETQEEGVASYYGTTNESEKGMYGAVTATGEPFVPSDITCASRHIPLGSKVIVEHVENGNWLICEVNDRGPYGAIMNNGDWVALLPQNRTQRQRNEWTVVHRAGHEWTGREHFNYKPAKWRGVMDLSYGTAKALDFDFNKGLNDIRIRYDVKNNEITLPLVLKKHGMTLDEKLLYVFENFKNTSLGQTLKDSAKTFTCPLEVPESQYTTLPELYSWK